MSLNKDLFFERNSKKSAKLLPVVFCFGADFTGVRTAPLPTLLFTTGFAATGDTPPGFFEVATVLTAGDVLVATGVFFAPGVCLTGAKS